MVHHELKTRNLGATCSMPTLQMIISSKNSGTMGKAEVWRVEGKEQDEFKTSMTEMNCRVRTWEKPTECWPERHLARAAYRGAKEVRDASWAMHRFRIFPFTPTTCTDGSLRLSPSFHPFSPVFIPIRVSTDLFSNYFVMV